MKLDSFMIKQQSLHILEYSKISKISKNGIAQLIQNKVFKVLQNLTPATLQIKIDAKPDQKFFKTKVGGKKKRKLAVFKGDDNVSGIVQINVKPDSQFQHYGVKVMLIGYLEIYDDNSLSTEFCSLTKQLVPAGTIKAKTVLKFKFQNFDKDYQSYYGICGQVRYYIRVTVVLDSYVPNMNKEVPFAVFKYQNQQNNKIVTPLKMDIGSENKFKIQIKINKNNFHLKDCIQGTIKFIQLKIDIKIMELWIVRKQKLGSDKFVQNQTQIMIKYEVIDGNPQVGKLIPIRMHLNGVYGLSPSFSSLHDRLTVSYLIKFMIVDLQGKKYYKESPITLYRHLKQQS